MYKTTTEGNTSILQRQNKSGIYTDIATVYNAVDSRIITIDKYKYKSYRFKANTVIRFKLVNNHYIATVRGEIKAYKLPHHTEYHREIMTANRGVYALATSNIYTPEQRDSIQIDYDLILDNMLDYIGVL